MAVSFNTLFIFFCFYFCIIVYTGVRFVCFCLILQSTYSYCYITYSFVSLRILIVMYVPFWVFCPIVLFCILFVCQCVLYYCHQAST